MPSWLRRELAWLSVLLAFGVLVLPAIVYAVGVQLLGEYRPDGGLGLFYRDLYAAAGEPEPWAWLLLGGPYLGVMALRLLWMSLRALREDPDESAAEY